MNTVFSFVPTPAKTLSIIVFGLQVTNVAQSQPPLGALLIALAKSGFVGNVTGPSSAQPASGQTLAIASVNQPGHSEGQAK